MQETGDTRTTRPTWDLALMNVTVSLMGALGLQSLVGTLYSWWAYRSMPGWEQTGQQRFVSVMNAVAAPLVVALIIVMGLCVPKRLLSRGTLVVASAAMVGLGCIVALAGSSVTAGLTAYLLAAALMQITVVGLTIAGAPSLTYLSGSRRAKTGSGLLHLGFIVMALVVVALQDSALMLPMSLLAAALLTGGSALAFYARPVPNASPVGEESA